MLPIWTSQIVKKKKSKWKETSSKSHSKAGQKADSIQDKMTWKSEEELVHKFQAEEEEQERQSWPKKPKKKDSSHWRDFSSPGLFRRGGAPQKEKEKGEGSQSMGRPRSATPGGKGRERKRGGQVSCPGETN